MKNWVTRLRALVPGSLQARGLLLILFTAVSVAVPTLMIGRLRLADLQQRQTHEFESLLAGSLRAHLETINQPAAEHELAYDRLEEAGKRLMWAGIFNRQGKGLAFQHRIPIPQSEIHAQIDFTGSEPTSNQLLIDGRASQRFELHTLPQPASDSILAVILDRGDAQAETSATTYAMLVGLALAGVVLSLAWFQYGIEQPVTRLGRSLRRLHEGLTDLAATSSTPPELASLVRTVSELQQDLKHWRNEASRLRHSVEHQVDSRTRRAALAERKAQRDADTDPLSGLENRRALERDLPELLTHAARDGSELSLLVVDVDNFKALNDQHGHRTGDELISFVGELIRGSLRRGQDRGVRYGGDEFVLILSHTTTEEARHVANRLCALFAQRARSFAKLRDQLRLSIGIASLQANGTPDAERLLRLADAAMYLAKRTGQHVMTARDVHQAVGAARQRQTGNNRDK